MSIWRAYHYEKDEPYLVGDEEMVKQAVKAGKWPLDHVENAATGEEFAWSSWTEEWVRF